MDKFSRKYGLVSTVVEEARVDAIKHLVELVKSDPLMGAFVFAWFSGVGYVAWSFIR